MTATPEFKITRATRQGVVPLIALYSQSGCGKTMSSLLLARGLIGPAGDIYMINTEGKRGHLYADVIPGGYLVLDFDPPFSPARYVGAIKTVLDRGAKAIVIDSISHEWEGEGGVLDMAAENEAIAEQKARERGYTFKPGGLNIWKQPKYEHAKLIQLVTRLSVPVVCCIRAKQKSHQTKDAENKTRIIKDDFNSPIQSSDFTFETTARGEVDQDHNFLLTKCSHPELRKCFPNNAPIEIKHGELVAKWCAAGGSTPPSESASSAKSAVKSLKTQLWTLLEPLHKGDKIVGKQKAEARLREAALLAPDRTLDSLTEPELATLIQSVPNIL